MTTLVGNEGEKFVVTFKTKTQNPQWHKTLKILNKNLPEYFPKIKKFKGKDNTWRIETKPQFILTQIDNKWTYTMETFNADSLVNVHVLISFLNLFTGAPRDRSQNMFWVSGLPLKFELEAFCHRYAKVGKLTEAQFKEVLDALSVKSVDKYVSINREFLEPVGLNNKIEKVFIDKETYKLTYEVIAKTLEMDINNLKAFINSKESSDKLTDMGEIVICTIQRLMKRLKK